MRNLMKNFENSRTTKRIGHLNAFQKIPVLQQRTIFEYIFGKSNSANKTENDESLSSGCPSEKKCYRLHTKNRRTTKDGICVALTGNFKIHNLDDRPSCYSYVTKDEAKLYYQQMQTIRYMETVSDALHKEEVIRGFCHLCSGQEACATGIKAAISNMDHVITAYRCHGWCYLMGLTPFQILAELAGNASGCQRGKGGSMHMHAKNFHGGNGIIGSQVPLGAGVALYCKHKTPGSVCFAIYGDGAANQGQVYEAYNIAHLWKLPCIFVCENNNYGTFTKAKRSPINTNYYRRGNDIPGIWVDGVDILAVRNATEFAIDYVLKHDRPLVMELDTYRYDGYSKLISGIRYRSRKKIQKIEKTSDPIMAFKSVCADYKLITPEEMKSIDEKVRKEVDEAVTKAKADKEVPLEELTADVYVKCMEPNIRDTIGYTLSHKLINQRGKEILENLNVPPVSDRRIHRFQQKNRKVKRKEKYTNTKNGKKSSKESTTATAF